MQIPNDLLGYRGDPKWRDMSDYLVHFTSRDALLSILNDRKIEARREFGWFRSDAPTSHLRMSACFSEIPIDQIDRLANRRGRYGIAFKRSFVQAAGGGRVWYAEEPQRTLVFNAYSYIYRADPTRVNPLWRLSPFFDDVTAAYDFTWEREWRAPGGLPFSLADVAFLIRPAGVGGSEVFEHPAPGVPLLSSEAAEFWNEAFYALGGPEDRNVDEFLKMFGNPIDYLNWDSEDQDYFWVVDKWNTRDAIADYLDDLGDHAAEALASRLDEISDSWVLLEDIEHVHE
jgi:hypothetical protein